MKNDSEYAFSGVPPQSQVTTVHTKAPKPVIYDANGTPLTRPIGFHPPSK